MEASGADAGPGPGAGALGRALWAACQHGDDAPALEGAAAALSRRQLAAQGQALAAQLRRAGLRPDEPVLVAVSTRVHDIAALAAVWWAGGVVVAVHRSTPPALVAALQQRTGARWSLGGWGEAAGTADAPPALHAWSDQPPPPRPLLAGAAFIVFTSGSTGEPKGVVLGHDAFHGKLGQIDALLHFQPTDRTLLVLNLSFGFGLWVALLTLLRGGVLVMTARFDPAGFVHSLVRSRITQLGVVPTMMRQLLADPRHAAALDTVAAAGCLRQLLIGGELMGQSLAQTLRERLPGSALVDIYGLTETSTCDFFAFPADQAAQPGCIGRPAPGVQHRITGADGRPVAEGEVGELQLRSPYLMAGYLDAPALTAAAWPDGWLCTGDLACQLADGRVMLRGRQKELISRAGHKLSPVEVEQALGAHPDVAAALVVGRPDPLLGQRIHALLVARPGARLHPAALRAHLLPRLEKTKHPDAWYLADALPLGRTGKADRGALAALIDAGQADPLADLP